MQDFSSVNIKNMIIHNVGNKVKGESLDLSTEICDTNNKVTNQYLKQFFFSTFKFDITYRFVHETDIAMNEIYNYVKHIFDNSDQFYEQSVNIAKHLYEVSVHPNIKAGELCIVYLQNCIIDDNVTDAVGIYKSESKDYYLQVNSTENGYDIECQQGIKPDWVEGHSDVVMTALLCGEWTEATGDVLVFEELSGKTYIECKKELETYLHRENPFVVRVRVSYSSKIF